MQIYITENLARNEQEEDHINLNCAYSTVQGAQQSLVCDGPIKWTYQGQNIYIGTQNGRVTHRIYRVPLD